MSEMKYPVMRGDLLFGESQRLSVEGGSSTKIICLDNSEPLIPGRRNTTYMGGGKDLSDARQAPRSGVLTMNS